MLFSIRKVMILMKLEKELESSLNKTHELYIHLLLLLVNLKSLAEEKIELRKNKLLPSQDDLEPNTKFIDNRILHLLSENLSLTEKAQTMPLFWQENREIQTKLLKDIQASELYLDYLSNSKSSFADDQKFISSLFIDFIASNEDIHAFLEESIYWSDDFSVVNIALIKTLKDLNPIVISMRDCCHFIKVRTIKSMHFRCLQKRLSTL